MTYYSLKGGHPSERLARQLEHDGDYRILRRLPEPNEVWCRSMPLHDSGASIVLGIIDTETTGLDPQRQKMVELAVVKLTIDSETGDVLRADAPVSWVEDPGEPLTPEIVALTGLSDADLQGRSFDLKCIRETFADVDVIVAHNAAFDRGFMTARLPDLAQPFACSAREIDWLAHGLGGGRSIGALLTSAGHFACHAHRAGPDAWALCCLLMMPGEGGKTLAWHLLERARRPTSRVYADRAPYAEKDALRAAGYRWAASARAWTKEGEPESIANEVAWLRGLHPAIEPRVVSIDWCNRHAA